MQQQMKEKLPSEFSIIFGSVPSMNAMAEFVVPKSIPSTFPIFLLLKIFSLTHHIVMQKMFSRGNRHIFLNKKPPSAGRCQYNICTIIILQPLQQLFYHLLRQAFYHQLLQMPIQPDASPIQRHLVKPNQNREPHHRLSILPNR